MDAMDRLRDAREHAGLTQRELADLLGTTQSAIARLEGHHVTPRLDTVEAYATAVGQHVEVRGPDLTGDCVRAVRVALDGHAGADAALRAIIQLSDDLLAAPDPTSVLRAEPTTTGSPRWDAAIAAACERGARLRGVDVPGWTAAPSRFLVVQRLQPGPPDHPPDSPHWLSHRSPYPLSMASGSWQYRNSGSRS